MKYGSTVLQRKYLTVAVLGGLFAIGTGTASAQKAEDPPGTDARATPAESTPKAENELDKVIVTGSRIKRTETEGPSPITIMTAQDLEREGFKTVFDAVSSITQATGSLQNEVVSASYTPNANAINLRGLGPGRSLLLINGRRAADYPLPYGGVSNFANYGNIPTAAVQRIEVLAGGASAIYGSDAVAGVINVILKTNFEGDQLKLRAGTTTQGGRDYGDLEWVGGKVGDKWSLTYALQAYSVEALWATERDFMDSPLDNPLQPRFGANQPDAAIRLRDLSVPRAGSYITPPAGTCEGLGDEWVRWNTFSTRDGVNLGQQCGSFKSIGYNTIASGSDDLSGYLYGTYDFSDGLSGWASLMAYRSRASYSGYPEWWGGPNGGSSWQDADTGHYLQAFRRFAPQEVGGLKKMMTGLTERSYDVAAGLRGTLGERFNWDATLSHAEYRAHIDQSRLVASRVNAYFLGPQLGADAFGTPIHRVDLNRYFTPLTPAQFQSLSSIYKTTGKSTVDTANIVFDGDLFEMPAGTVGFAAVLEASRQSYSIDADPRLLPGYTGSDAAYNWTGTGGGGKRNRYALGAEMSIPLLDSLKLNLAGRFDKYDDITNVDDAKTWNAGIEWRPVSNLLIRGNYATSFRAPDMHYVFADPSGGYYNIFDTYRCLQTGSTTVNCGNDPSYNYSTFAVRQGNARLEEETGKSWTAGVVWDITDTLSITADYYSIELDGVVNDLYNSYILDGEAGCRTGLDRNRNPFTLGAPGSAFCNEMLSRVRRNSSGNIVQITTGPVNTKFQGTTGIDASLRYTLDTDRFGDFRFNLSYSHTLTQTAIDYEGDPEYDYRDAGWNHDFRSRVRGSVLWDRNDWDVGVSMVRDGSLPNWAETSRLAPYYTWNLGVGRKITHKAKLAVSINNVFDKTPPNDATHNTYPYFWYGYSPIGRQVSLEFTYDFK